MLLKALCQRRIVRVAYDKLKALLEELFQFDREELDFGIYRIMNQEQHDDVGHRGDHDDGEDERVDHGREPVEKSGWVTAKMAVASGYTTIQITTAIL